MTDRAETTSEISLAANARTIPITLRTATIRELTETDLHQKLKALLERKIKNSVVEITHGPEEFGKDVVLVDPDDPLGERVAAFVVKTGAVSGKSSGRVDEIKTQVEQAWQYPARLRSLLRPKNVNQVFVIIAGTVSSHAATRINAELQGKVQHIWDLNRLVTEFTDHYPQVFYETQLLDFLQKRITELESHPLFVKISSDRNLSEWFVDPTVASRQSLDPADLTGDDFFGGSHFYSFVKLKDLIRRSKRLLLVGAPGSGKSAVLAKLALDLMKDAFHRATAHRRQNINEVPILVTARRLLDYPDLTALRRDQFGDENLVDNVRVSALLIDGLDEVPPAQRDAALQKAVDFSRELVCALVITSRLTEALQNPIPMLQQAELLEFQVGQAIRLFEKLVPDAKLLQSLRQGLDEIQNQLQMTPLTLTLLIDVVKEAQEIPSSVTELYDLFFDYSLGRHDYERGIEVLFAYQVKRTFLGELAFECFFQKKTIEISRTDFDEFCRVFAERYGHDPDQIPSFINEIDRANVLRLSEDIVEFCNRSFLDYFVAVEMHSHEYDADLLHKTLVQTYFSPQWTEVAFFYVGIDRKIPQPTMNAILDHDGDTLGVRVMKFLSGRLLQAAWHSRRDVKEKSVAAAVDQAPAIRDDLVNQLFEDPLLIPSFIGDVYLVLLGGMSFGSTWLLDANRKLLDQLLSAPSYDNLLKAISLLGALRRKVSEPELQDRTNQAQAALALLSPSPEIQARFLTALMMVGAGNETLHKKLLRQLKKVLRRHPGLRETLLPSSTRRLPPARRQMARARKRRKPRR